MPVDEDELAKYVESSLKIVDNLNSGATKDDLRPSDAKHETDIIRTRLSNVESQLAAQGEQLVEIKGMLVRLTERTAPIKKDIAQLAVLRRASA
jgi:hypothetical protein